MSRTRTLRPSQIQPAPKAAQSPAPRASRSLTKAMKPQRTATTNGRAAQSGSERSLAAAAPKITAPTASRTSPVRNVRYAGAKTVNVSSKPNQNWPTLPEITSTSPMNVPTTPVRPSQLDPTYLRNQSPASPKSSRRGAEGNNCQKRSLPSGSHSSASRMPRGVSAHSTPPGTQARVASHAITPTTSFSNVNLLGTGAYTLAKPRSPAE